MDRAMCPYLLLGETARSIYNGEGLKGENIEVGVDVQSMTLETKNVFRSYTKELLESDNLLSYKVGNVPIVVSFIDAGHGYFKHPDTRFYLTAVFRVPNPFKSYWESREQVK